MASTEGAIHQQLELHHRICRIIDNTKKLGKEKITTTVINMRFQSLESYWAKFQSGHERLVAARTDETKTLVYFADDFYAQCEGDYFETKGELLSRPQPAVYSYLV